LPLALAALAGCVAEDGFPSLALRPAELNRSIEAPDRPRTEIPSDPALRARIAALVDQARGGDRDFAAALGAAEAAVTRAGAAGSESWVEAQLAVSRLEATRTATSRALAELDQLALARAEAATNSEDFAAIETALADVEAVAAAQQQRWDRLRGRLASLN
jgi:hypothetical protein